MENAFGILIEMVPMTANMCEFVKGCCHIAGPRHPRQFAFHISTCLTLLSQFQLWLAVFYLCLPQVSFSFAT